MLLSKNISLLTQLHLSTTCIINPQTANLTHQFIYLLRNTSKVQIKKRLIGKYREEKSPVKVKGLQGQEYNKTIKELKLVQTKDICKELQQLITQALVIYHFNMESAHQNFISQEESTSSKEQLDLIVEEQKIEAPIIKNLSHVELQDTNLQMTPSKWEVQTPQVNRKEGKYFISPKKERKEKYKEQRRAEKIDLESCIRVLTYGVTSETNSPAKRITHDVEVCNVIVPCLYCPLQNNQSPEAKHAFTSEKMTGQIFNLKVISSKLEKVKQLERADSFEEQDYKNDWFQEEGFNKVNRRKKRLLSITEKGKILKYGYGETAHEQNPNSTASLKKGRHLAISIPKKP